MQCTKVTNANQWGCCADRGQYEAGVDVVPVGADPGHMLQKRNDPALVKRGAVISEASKKAEVIIRELIAKWELTSIDTDKQVRPWAKPLSLVHLYKLLI